MKRERMLAGLALAVLLTAGASGTALAAGWVQENGVWKYTDSQGNYVTNRWEQSGGKYYYLGSDGVMVTNAWVEDQYYVGADGVMASNCWLKMNTAADGKEAGWYFLTSSGKMKTDGWETINGREYAFDSDGRMRYGWFFDDEDIYYLGGPDDGAMKTGWRCLAYDEEMEPDDGDVSEQYSAAGEESRWFYFQSNGKAVHADDEEYKRTTIDNKKYYFDENGVMASGWIAAEDDAESGDSTGISRFIYLGTENEGNMYQGTWVYLDEHPWTSDDEDAIEEGDDEECPEEGENAWYYLENDGTPAYLKSTADSMNDATTKVGSSSYFFNEYGVMRTGLIKLSVDGKNLVGYFGDDSPYDTNPDSYMRTGRQTIYDDAGDRYTFYFGTSGSNKGAGYNGERDDYLYYEGCLVEAEDGQDYEVFFVDGDAYLVNESGRVQTSSKAYRCDGDYMYRISGGKIYYTDDDGEAEDEVTDGDGSALPEVVYHEEYDL